MVWKAVDKKTRAVVALKKCFDAFRNSTDAQRTFREVMYLQELSGHDNIIRLVNIIRCVRARRVRPAVPSTPTPHCPPLHCPPRSARPAPHPSAENDRDIYLVFDFMETDLHAVIRAGILQDIHRQYVIYQLLKSLHFLHTAELIHRDVKPSNSASCALSAAGAPRAAHLPVTPPSPLPPRSAAPLLQCC